MDSAPPAPWTFAARAAYFGDRVCAFCEHRNPASAKFCNDCGSPLHLKPCNQCNAVNHQAATNCHQCGAECPALLIAPEATPFSPAADTTPALATPTDVGDEVTVTQPLFAAGVSPTGWRLLRPGRLAAIATILVAGIYAAYRISVATPDPVSIASQPIDAGEHDAPTPASAVPIAMEATPIEPEATVAQQAPIPATNADARKHASARHRPAPVHATNHASARQRPGPVPASKRASARPRQAPIAAASPAVEPHASAPVSALVGGSGIANDRGQ